jgi:hypothetical protein
MDRDTTHVTLERNEGIAREDCDGDVRDDAKLRQWSVVEVIGRVG